MSPGRTPRALEEAREEFLTRWGALGPAWGVNRTMSRIHALLMVSTEPLNTDQVMAELGVSRGNAHTNIKELVSWGLLKPVRIEGDRKEYFEAEKDVWRVVQLIVRERKRKELRPVLETLDGCIERTSGLKNAEARAFREQLEALRELAGLADSVMDKVGRERSKLVLPWLKRFLK
jgi:DNA-binding transcriptional regulator GbsR (MarR family)